MGRSNALSRLQTLRLMRHLADVASLRNEPIAQRQLLTEGLNQLFDTTVGWLFAFDHVRPGRQLQPLMQVVAGEQPLWERYCQTFVQHVGAEGDFYAHAIVHSQAVEQQWRLKQVLSCHDDLRQFDPAVQLMQEVRLGEGAVCAWRCGPGQNRVVGFSLHRFAGEPGMTERDYALHRLALSEIRRLCRRGTLQILEKPGPVLPARLQQVLDRLLVGQTPRQIAAGLGISLWTVREHIQRLYVQFGVNTREELMAHFITRPCPKDGM